MFHFIVKICIHYDLPTTLTAATLVATTSLRLTTAFADDIVIPFPDEQSKHIKISPD